MDTRVIQKGSVLLIPGFLFGLLVAAQWSTFASGIPDVAIRYVEPLNTTVTSLQSTQDSLRRELAGLRAQLDDLQRRNAQQTGAASGLQQEIEALRVAAGLTTISGEGVLVTLDNAQPAPERPTCLSPDLTDITNAAWRAGARGIAINGERLIASSSVYCVGATLVVNGSVVSAPFEVAAIGNGAAIVAMLDDPTQLRDLKRRRDTRTVIFRVTRSPSIEITPYTGPLTVRTAIVR